MTATKFWVAFTLGFAETLRVITGADLGLDETTLTIVVQSLIAGAVWLFPNKPKV